MFYRFSPIHSQAELLAAVTYIAKQTSQLCKEIIGKDLPIHTLTVFSHFDDEFEFLCKILSTNGTPYNENNGPRVTLHQPIIVDSNTITHLRIRKPDPDRPQVGCNDFDINDYTQFKSAFLSRHPEHLSLIRRPEYEMIEFHHSDFDVLAYIVSKKD